MDQAMAMTVVGKVQWELIITFHQRATDPKKPLRVGPNFSWVHTQTTDRYDLWNRDDMSPTTPPLGANLHVAVPEAPAAADFAPANLLANGVPCIRAASWAAGRSTVSDT